MTTNFRTEGDINFSPERKRWDQSITDSQSKHLLEEDAKYFFHQYMSTPCLDVLENCHNGTIRTLSGKKLFDFHGNSVHQVGFGNPYVIQKIKEQLDKLSFSTRRFTNQPAINLAKKLIDKMPNPNYRVLFAPGGTSAIGIALKLARAVTGNHKVVSLWDSFHGASLDSISAGGEASFRTHMGPLMPGILQIPPPTQYRGFFGDTEKDQLKYADYLEYVVEKEGGVGAFISETIRNTDVQIPTKTYWKRVREICDKHNIVLILDEIPIGMGRTGKQFAFEHFDIEPDIVCLGKSLGGGIFPMAAMIGREEYNVAPEISLGHYTHEKSPVGSAAALAAIEYIEKENLLQKVIEESYHIKTRLEELADKFECIGHVRGIGFLWGVELVKNKITKEKANELAEKVMYECLQNGLSFKVSQGNVLTLAPALTISRNELTEAFTILENALTKHKV
nr:aspartate aminotransferase family protein [uncultured Draconibacterium sp.]